MSDEAPGMVASRGPAADLAITGGTVVAETGARPGDLYVRDGRIVAITEPGQGLGSRAMFDATGLHILPGLIDAHAHFRSFTKHRDAFADTSRSAAYGGVTTIIGHLMGMGASPFRPRDRVAHVMEEAARGASTDYSFHVGLADEPYALEDIEAIIDLGLPSFKMFMAYRARGIMVDDRFMLRAMAVVAAGGALPLVHAEAGDVADHLEGRIREAGTPVGPAALAASRPSWVEAEATRRALALARAAGSDAYFVHVSSPDAVEAIRAAPAGDAAIYAETCPQYLTLTIDDFARIGGLAKIAPPLRSEAERGQLLRKVAQGDLQVIASDHSPYSVADKTGDLWAIPFGAPGTETLLTMTWRALRAAGLEVTDLSRLLATAPARIFGLYPLKGVIAVGSDADLTIVDLAGTTVIDGHAQHNTSGYSMYDGMTSPLRLVATFLRGRSLLRDGAVAPRAHGKFLSRSRRARTGGAAGRP